MKMKTLLALTAALGVAASANAQLLLGGFDGINELNAPRQSDGLTGLTVELTTDAPQTSSGGQMVSNLWGSVALTPEAQSTGVRNTDPAVVRGGIVDIDDNPAPWTWTLTITNNTGFDVTFDQIHYRTKKDTNDGPATQTITYTSGDLAETNGLNSGAFTFEGGENKPVDVDLSTFLTNDLTLAGSGETAVFTWSHGTAANLAGNTGVRIDNIAISGSIVPEASAAALIGIASLALLARRRR